MQKNKFVFLPHLQKWINLLVHFQNTHNGHLIHLSNLTRGSLLKVSDENQTLLLSFGSTELAVHLLTMMNLTNKNEKDENL